MNKVYKYRANVATGNWEKDSVQMAKGFLYAAKLNKMNDPFEGSVELPKSDRHERWVTPLIQDLHTIGIYSLSKPKENETFPCNELLWAHYANSHKGFCIEYDLDILLKNHSSQFDIRNQIHVVYKNERPEVSESDSLFDVQSKVFGTKSLAWKYENEVRLVFLTEGEKPIPPEAITAIYFGLNMSLEDRQEKIRLMVNRNIDYYQIERIENSYKLISTKISFDYQYELVDVEKMPLVDNYMILYKSPNKDKNTMHEFVEKFRSRLTRPSNLTIIDDIRAKRILKDYKPRSVMTQEDIIMLSKHWIAYSSFDAPKYVWMYPEK